MHSDDAEQHDLKGRLERLEMEVDALRIRVRALEGTAEEPAAPPPVPALAPAAETPVKPAPIGPSNLPAPTPPPLPPPPVHRARVDYIVPRPRPVQPGQDEGPPAAAGGGPGETGPSSLQRFLRAVHLVPPSGEGSGEAQLGAWWATRLGMLLVVLAVVFFGVYVSIGTPPWVKLAELGTVSLAIALAGAWLEKRVGRRLGGVILGGGLALVYFTAFAAYAIPPVKVTDQIAVAATLQAVAVAIVFAVAVRRSSPTVATMATVLGFVSAFFSVGEGFDDFAVFGALVLAAACVGLRHWKGWATPILFAVVLAHAIVGAVALSIWDTEVGQRSPGFVFGVLAAVYGMFFLSLVLEGTDDTGAFARVQRWLQSLNGSLGAVAGYLAATTVLSRDDVSLFLFAGGGVLVLAGLWAWRKAPSDPLPAAFFVKASALLATGAMLEWEARTRWMALLVEALVLLAAARRMRRPVLALVATFIWVLSLFFFLREPAVPSTQQTLVAWLILAVYVASSPLLLAFALRLAQPVKAALGAVLGFGLGAALPAWRAADMAAGTAWGPLALTLCAATLVLAAVGLRSQVPFLAAAVLLLRAHAALHAYSLWRHGAGWLWVSVVAVAGAAALGAWWMIERQSRHRTTGTIDRGQGALLGPLLVLLALSSFFAGAFLQWPVRPALGAGATVAAAVTWLGAWRGRRGWQWGGVLGAVAVIPLFHVHAGRSLGTLGSMAWLWLAALGGVLVLIAAVPAREGRSPVDRAAAWMPWLAAFAATLLLWDAITEAYGAIGRAWAAVAVMVAFCVIARERRLGAAFGASSALAGAVMISILTDGAWPPHGDHWPAMCSAWALGTAVAVLPAAAGRLVDWVPAPLGRAWRWLQLFAGVFFVIAVSLERPAAWASLTTVLWALAGIVLFLAGLYCRARSHRIGGLVVLALCLPRVFLVDINSTLYRIAAFVVLGLVLLWVGFSYQRFRHLVEGADADRDGADAGTSDHGTPASDR